MARSSLKKSRFDIVVYILYFFVAAFFLLPVLCILSMSFKIPAEIFSGKSLLPKSPTLDNFKYVIESTRMLTYIKNSFVLVVITVIGTLVIASLSAYSLSRFKFKRKNLIIIFLLMFQMISDVIIAIPLFRFFSLNGLLNNYAALGLVFIASKTPFATYLLKGVFDSIPTALDESASIDGASKLLILRKIIIPCSRSGISSTIIFLAINSWSSFLLPFILLNKDKLLPVSVGIVMIQGTYRDITIQYLAAASIIGLLPAILIVLFLQKFIISAMMSGAVKG